MAYTFTDNEVDFLNMLNGRSSEIREFAETRLRNGSTLHSVHAQLVAEEKIIRGWLIGRFGR